MKLRRSLPFALALAVCGCGSSPEPTYFALSPQTPSVTSGAGAVPDVAPRRVKLRRPSLVGYLDRSSIVRRVVDYQLQVAKGEKWGEPLDQMVARVLADDLTTRLPGSTVYSELGSLSLEPDAVVEVDVQAFDVGADGLLTLRAQIVVARGDDPKTTQSDTVTLSEKPAGADTASLVRSMSILLGRASDKIAVMLRAAR